MSSINQILALVKQELRIAVKSRYIILAFILMPLVMWVMQGGYLTLMTSLTTESTQEGETIFVANFDGGNSSLNELIPGTGDNLGDYLVSQLVFQTVLPPNMSMLSGASIDNTTYCDMGYTELVELMEDPKRAGTVTPLIIIHENFTSNYLAYTSSSSYPPAVSIHSLPGGIIGSQSLVSAVWTVISQPPYQVIDVHKTVSLSNYTILFEGEESAGSGIGAGFIGMFSVMIAVFAPAAFVTSSFAGEREKKTMESLLALPISRFHILLSKLIAGMGLISIFAIMNAIGVVLFSVIIDVLNTGDQTDSVMAAFSFEITPSIVVLITITMFLAAFVATGIGIAVASLSKDVQSAQSTYNFVMILPAAIVGISGMFGGLPENAFGGAGIYLYILPWAHIIAILRKGMYPLTCVSSAITGDIALDMLLHLGYIVVVIAIFLVIASKLFDREGILT